MKMVRGLVSLVVIGGAVLSTVLAPDVAWADKRVALVVGNSSYHAVSQLANPVRDATAVAQMFTDAGFDSVTVELNVGNLEFKRSIRKFRDSAATADIAVIYFAGHGLEINGTNYLIPVDAKLASDLDADDEAIPLERVVASAEGAKKLRLIILDACRDNPYGNQMRRDRRAATRAIAATGLGRVEPSGTDTLIAYAAKAGSTADDGDWKHSPFTTAVLKNLTVPGLDVRLAFGRIRDEVLKSTGSRQEPFVYGSLGGGNISLVPAPTVPVETSSASDLKTDYDLVEKIGTPRAWQVFLGAHPEGFYADLARAQIERLSKLVQSAKSNIVLASLPPTPSPSSRESPTKEAIEWDKIKESTDITVLQKFVKKYPASPLAIIAEQRVDVLKTAAQEREDKARADKEAAQKAAEAARQEAERKKVELAASKKREEDERRAKAEAADQQARAAEAERKAVEAKQKAEEATKNKAAAEAEILRVASEKQAKEAEEARRKAEFASGKEAACKKEQDQLGAIQAKGSDGSGIDDLKAFSKAMSCDRLRAVTVATLDRFNDEAAKRAAAMPNSFELVRAAQAQLARVGCFIGKMDANLNKTQTALGNYLRVKGQAVDKTDVTETVVAELTKQTDRVCPLECKGGEVAKGDVCIATDKPVAPPVVASRPKSDDDQKPAPKKQSRKEDDSDKPAAKKPKQAERARQPEPRARQQASNNARSNGSSGNSGGGHSTVVGVGF
jgi:Caspase domain